MRLVLLVKNAERQFMRAAGGRTYNCDIFLTCAYNVPRKAGNELPRRSRPALLREDRHAPGSVRAFSGTGRRDKTGRLCSHTEGGPTNEGRSVVGSRDVDL